MNRDDTPTPSTVDTRDVNTSPFVMDVLRRVHPELPHALRVGILIKIVWEAQAMVEPDAGSEHIVLLRELVELLAKMPWKAPGD